MPPTVVTQATTWWETVLALVKLQEIGLGVNLPVKVHMLFILSHPVMVCDIMTTHWHMVGVLPTFQLLLKYIF